MKIPDTQIVVSKKDFELDEIQFGGNEMLAGLDIAVGKIKFDVIYEILFNTVNMGIIADKAGVLDVARDAIYAYCEAALEGVSHLRGRLSEDSKKVCKWLDSQKE